MSERLTNILGYLTLAAILAAIWILFGEDPTRDQGARGELTFSGLSERINETASILITKDGQQVSLKRNGSAWQVENREGFTANNEMVRAFLRGFALSTRREPKTANMERFDRLGLGADAIQVKLADDTDGTLLDIRVGTRKESGGGRSLTYVFQASDTRSWLVSRLVAIATEPSEWLKTELYSVAKPRIRRVRYSDAVLVRASKGADFTLEGLQANEQPAENWQLAEPARMLSLLKVEDVQRLANPITDPTGTVTLETYDGLNLQLSAFDLDGATWVQVVADYDPKRADELTVSELSEAQVEGVAEAEKINAAANGWLFKLAELEAGLIMRRRGDFVKKNTESNSGS
jgi:hypothetical protein